MTAVDRTAETVIVAAIRRAFSDHEIVAEELGAVEGPGSYRWYVDPLRKETASAVRTEAARLNGAPIRVSAATGFPCDRRRRADFYLTFVQEALAQAQCARRGGSAALDLCHVAAGRLDGFYEWKLQSWDTAAGRLILEEAGGRVTDFAGAPPRLPGEQTAASNGAIHDALRARLARARRRLRLESEG